MARDTIRNKVASTTADLNTINNYQLKLLGEGNKFNMSYTSVNLYLGSLWETEGCMVTFISPPALPENLTPFAIIQS